MSSAGGIFPDTCHFAHKFSALVFSDVKSDISTMSEPPRVFRRPGYLSPATIAGALDPDEYIYVYGVEDNPQGRKLLVARVHKSDFTNPLADITQSVDKLGNRIWHVE